MIEVTAQQRVGRAINSKTRNAVHIDDYHAGGIVALYRSPANNEVSGWRGRATIVHVETDGAIH
eukprot:5381330-Prorocentrum_lima.AAC.1